jgi:hypothetical protein
MHWLNRLEQKVGHLAIPALMRYVAGLTALCYVLVKINPNYLDVLWLQPSLVLEGQVWRLFTYLFIPIVGGFLPDWLFGAFYILYLMWIGDGLERAMGTFRMNAYFLLGMIGTTIAAWITGGTPGGGYLYLSLFLAFARFFPDVIIYVMFILPMKVKWIAWLDVAFLLLAFMGGAWTTRAAILVGFINYFLFFGRELVTEARFRHQVMERKARFVREIKSDEGEAMHRCAVCQRTEATNPELDFRVSADGEEYCAEHLPKKA